MVADPTDAELVGLTRGGGRDAYGMLVTRYQGHVYGLAYSLARVVLSRSWLTKDWIRHG